MKTILAAGALALAAAAADAATVNVFTSLTPEQTAAATQDVATPDIISGGFFQNVTGSVGGVRRSPYDRLPALASTGKYHSVQGGGSVTYAFDDLQTGFSLLWGSPDSYNTLAFFNGDEAVDLGMLGFSISGTEVASLAQLSPLGQRFTFVDISDIAFDRVVLSSGSNAFEYGLVGSTPAPVPLPAAAWLLLAGMGALVAVRRRTA
jgi:hypothetical protein